ncbi:hypothetical protein BCR33DRAFT_743739 [Rhizoclosmatium globosum]|uniref:Uncharacterized protein n=1 Tax=Rhizoclosmatium globosum TaxID=329046 RepID=A0A1Y2BFD9_9FUNG|nr:hypothetical protein BCR33DRAFT_743739 [Rhizoclosmatium globosum]|eukprot:ORY33524.1 hypothetical protein BCR33DRAFT_743739 [Rhizoclosmatium globosum]
MDSRALAALGRKAESASGRRLGNVAIKSPIEQNFTHGTLPSGAYRQFNIEKGRVLSVQEWFDLCGDKTYAAPSTSTAASTSTSSLQPATQQATPLKKRVRKCKVALNPQEEPVQPQIALAADQVVSESVSSINHSDADTPPPPTCSATPYLQLPLICCTALRS